MMKRKNSKLQDLTPTVFLDRDGVISIFTPNDYVKKWEEFVFIPGAIKGLKLLYDNNYRIIIISNQAGVNKGLFTKEALEDITKKMLSELKKQGIEIAKVYYCPHTPEENCECRKPKPGLFFKAQDEFPDIDMKDAFFVGDSEIDVQAGKSAGTRTILVLSGKTRTAEEINAWSVKPDFIANDLSAAVQIILNSG